MIYELKMWNWLAPGIVAGLLLGLAMFFGGSDVTGAEYCAGALVFVVVLLFVQTISGYRAFYRQIEVNQFSQKRTALADTSEVRLAEFMRQMHPETVRLFMKHRLEVWRIKEMRGEELFTLVLDADPRINMKFLEYVLRHSNPYALMPKRVLNDKAKTFDPLGVVTDYEQYDALASLMMRRGWVTDGFGGQPPVWIEPWRPELVARRFGLDIFDEVDDRQDVGQPVAIENK
jgi:hypothetical protein